MIWKEFSEEVRNSKEPSWLKEFRLDSLRAFENSNPENTELFKHQTLFKDFNMDEFQDDKKPNSSFHFNLPEELKAKGVVISSLDEVKENPQFKQSLISNSKIDDKFSHMNNAMFTSGLYIYVPKGLEIEEPIRLITNIDSNLINKVVLVLDSNSKLNVIKEDYSKGGNSPVLYSDSIEVLIKDGAELHLSHLQNLGQNAVHLANKVGTCHKDSKILWNIGYFGGKKVRSRVHSVLLGEGSEAEDIEVAFGNNEQKFDVYSTLLHTGKNTTGRVLTNCVLKDKAVSIIKGMIKISEGAKNSNSFLAEHGMLLSRESRARAIPGLEIDTNEVKATHSASVSQIEDDKIFYMMSRGLSTDDSKKMIALGFFEPVIQKMLLDEMKTKISNLLELKWQGKEDDFLKSYGKIEVKESKKKRKEDIFSGHYKYR